ncbi:MAG: T9SS type A sorting domain-containing protein [Ignavibacteria bacterium]|nr:T9SS type A sorting domain-containing protein [Ignavibacteria bacterium]
MYDVLGREVQTLVNERLQPGTYEIKFEGGGLNSGIYYYRMTAGGYSGTRKIILIK